MKAQVPQLSCRTHGRGMNALKHWCITWYSLPISCSMSSANILPAGRVPASVWVQLGCASSWKQASPHTRKMWLAAVGSTLHAKQSLRSHPECKQHSAGVRSGAVGVEAGLSQTRKMWLAAVGSTLQRIAKFSTSVHLLVAASRVRSCVCVGAFWVRLILEAGLSLYEEDVAFPGWLLLPALCALQPALFPLKQCD